MSNQWVGLLQDLVDSIPQVKQPDSPWDTLPDDYDFNPDQRPEFKQQVLFNVLRYSGWESAKTSILIVKGTLEGVEPHIISEYKMDGPIHACYRSFKTYVDTLSVRLQDVDKTVDQLFLIRPKEADKISELIIGPLGQLKKALQDLSPADLLLPPYSAALGAFYQKGGLTQAELEKFNALSGSIIKQTEDFIRDNASVQKASDPKEIQRIASELTEYASEMQTRVLKQTAALEDKLQASWGASNQDIEDLYRGSRDRKGFEALIKDLERHIDDTLSPKVVGWISSDDEDEEPLLREDSSLAGRGEDGSQRDWSALFKVVSDAEKSTQKINQGFYVEFFWIMCILILAGGIACLGYYAYELHIKPLHLGIGLGLAGLGVLGLVIRHFYLKSSIRVKLPPKVVKPIESTELQSVTRHPSVEPEVAQNAVRVGGWEPAGAP